MPATVYGHHPCGAASNRLPGVHQRCLNRVRSLANRERGSGDRFCVTTAAPSGKVYSLTPTEQFVVPLGQPLSSAYHMLNMPLGLEAPSSHSALTRRQLLQVGGLSMLGLGLPGVARARETGRQAPASEKSCIFIVLGGGPSHVDTWDPKPEAPAEIRGP